MKIYAEGEDIDEIQTVKDVFRILPPPAPYADVFVFRGHRDWSWKLTPTLFRLNPFPSTGGVNWAWIETNILNSFFSDAVPYLGDFFIDNPLRRRMLAQHYGAPTRLGTASCRT